MARPQKTGSRSLGAFKGVFIPTFLSIIGVILYLRLGYIVGSVGILWTLVIIILAVSVTVATGLSLSSITTNIRIGAGGAYSIISKTLGLEIGGSVGIPLYLAQVFSVVLYIFGFTETWLHIFPTHPRYLILAGAFFLLVMITAISSRLAIKAQMLVFGLVILSLISIFAGGNIADIAHLPALHSLPDIGFWALFALFFPAVTGLMAGVGLSGELTDPKKQIPKGVLWALGTTFIIYIATTFWLGNSVSPEVLVTNKLFIIELAAYAPIVMIGILAATFSSALTTIVAAPRLLQAMGNNSILPFSDFFRKKTQGGEPRNAMIFTSAIMILLFMTGNLDSIAPILTMFFLISYAMINLVVFIEQSLGMVSYRPTLKISKLLPLYGTIGSLIFMFYINVIAGAIAVAFLFLTYILLVKKRLSSKGYVKSGLFFAVSEWAAKKVASLQESLTQIWKPNVFLPLEKSDVMLQSFSVLESIVYPNGILSVLQVRGEKKHENPDNFRSTIEKLREKGVFCSYNYVEAKDYINALCISLEALEGQFFHPNILFMPLQGHKISEQDLKRMFKGVRVATSGMALYDKNHDVDIGSRQDIHVWIPSKVLKKTFYDDRDFDLAMLLGYRLQKNWKGKLHLWMATRKKDEADRYLKRFVYEARLPEDTQYHISGKGFKKLFKEAPKGDIHLVSVSSFKELKEFLKLNKKVKKSCLITLDSGHEDILA